MADPTTFFHNAVRSICGSLDIVKATQGLYDLLATEMPIHRLGLIHVDPKNGASTNLVVITPSGPQPPPKLPFPDEIKSRIRSAIVENMRKNAGSPWINVIPDIPGDLIFGPLSRLRRWQENSGLVMGLILDGEVQGILILGNCESYNYSAQNVELILELNDPLTIAMCNGLKHAELARLTRRLEADNRVLREEMSRLKESNVIGENGGLKKVMDKVQRVSGTNSPVLILGETGVGKELIAEAIHNRSVRENGPLVKVNCGAIPPSLVDSELFGHEKGSFTGASSRRMGSFELADGGTLFLDEVGELPLDVQVRLLRVLQEKEITRVGGTGVVPVDIRIIAATNRDLAEMVREGRFREDLFYRLNVFPIEMPPLRDRLEDLPKLITHFIRKKSEEMGRATLPSPGPGVQERLMAHPWPGNVRELENTVERALIMEQGDTLMFSDLASPSPPPEHTIQPNASAVLDLDDTIRHHITKVMEMAEGKVEGPDGASSLLGVNPSTLRKRMRKLGIPFGRQVMSLKG